MILEFDSYFDLDNDNFINDDTTDKQPLRDNENALVYNSFIGFFKDAQKIILGLDISNDASQTVGEYSVILEKTSGLPVEIKDKTVFLRYTETFDKYLYLYLISVAFMYNWMLENKIIEHNSDINNKRLSYQELVNEISNETMEFKDYYVFYTRLYKSDLYKKYKECIVSDIKYVEELSYFRDLIYVLYLELFKKFKNNLFYHISKHSILKYGNI